MKEFQTYEKGFYWGDEEERKPDIMRCPYCGKDMPRGYITGDRPAYFSDSAMFFRKLFPLKGDIVLEGYHKRAKGYKCENCKIIIFDYNAMEQI